MKRYLGGISIPSNLNQLVAIAGFAVVVMMTLGVQAFWPSWIVPVIGAFLGWVAVGDVKGFLLAGLALIAVKWGLTQLPVFGPLVRDFSNNLIALVAPAMLVVSIRSIYNELKG